MTGVDLELLGQRSSPALRLAFLLLVHARDLGLLPLRLLQERAQLALVRLPCEPLRAHPPDAAVQL